MRATENGPHDVAAAWRLIADFRHVLSETFLDYDPVLHDQEPRGRLKAASSRIHEALWVLDDLPADPTDRRGLR